MKQRILFIIIALLFAFTCQAGIPSPKRKGCGCGKAPRTIGGITICVNIPQYCPPPKKSLRILHKMCPKGTVYTCQTVFSGKKICTCAKR